MRKSKNIEYNKAERKLGKNKRGNMYMIISRG